MLNQSKISRISGTFAFFKDEKGQNVAFRVGDAPSHLHKGEPKYHLRPVIGMVVYYDPAQITRNSRGYFCEFVCSQKYGEKKIAEDAAQLARLERVRLEDEASVVATIVFNKEVERLVAEKEGLLRTYNRPQPSAEEMEAYDAEVAECAAQCRKNSDCRDAIADLLKLEAPKFPPVVKEGEVATVEWCGHRGEYVCCKEQRTVTEADYDHYGDERWATGRTVTYEVEVLAWVHRSGEDLRKSFEQMECNRKAEEVALESKFGVREVDSLHHPVNSQRVWNAREHYHADFATQVGYSERALWKALERLGVEV